MMVYAYCILLIEYNIERLKNFLRAGGFMNYLHYSLNILILCITLLIVNGTSAILEWGSRISNTEVRTLPNIQNFSDISKTVELERLARQLTEDLAFSLNYYTTKKNLRSQVEKSFSKLLQALTTYVVTIYHERKYDLARTNFYYIRSKLLLLKKAVDDAFEELDLEMINKAIVYDTEERTLAQKEKLISFEKQKAQRTIHALTQTVNSLIQQVKNLPIP